MTNLDEVLGGDDVYTLYAPDNNAFIGWGYMPSERREMLWKQIQEGRTSRGKPALPSSRT